MTQYDAGPGDWSDREWEAPDHKLEPQARRRRVVLPPWALLAGLVAIVILACVGLVIGIRAISGGDDETPEPTAAGGEQGTATATVTLPGSPTASEPPTATAELPPNVVTDQLPPSTEIERGATVVVQNTRGAGLNLRAEPATTGRVVVTVRDGTVLTVVDGPQVADEHTWWKVRTTDGAEGWAAGQWLALAP